MCKLPKKISISHTDYKVISAPILDKGTIEYKRPVITVDVDLHKTERVDVLIHEILHGLQKHYNIQMEGMEEHIVSALGDGLTSVFKKNPDLLRYLKEELHG